MCAEDTAVMATGNPIEWVDAHVSSNGERAD
jgi:hypothetical protein